MENNATNVSANFRSSRPEVFYRKGVLRPETCDFIKKETLAQLLSCEFCEISKKTFFTEQLRTTVSEALKPEMNRNIDKLIQETAN